MLKTFSEIRSRRGKSRAFTLVEILVVISLIVVLASMTFALAGPVKNSILTTKAKSQIQKISLALNEFKSKYGEYPMVENSGTDDTWAQLLLDAVRGTKILVRRNGKIQMIAYTDGRSGVEAVPFLSLSDFTLDEEGDPENATQILDPWDNIYQYRYNTISGGKMGSDWDAPSFLLISAGADYNEPLETEDFFVDDMEKTGLFETDSSSSSYYYEDVRADNLVNLDMGL